MFQYVHVCVCVNVCECMCTCVCVCMHVRGDGREFMITDETDEAPFSLSATNVAIVVGVQVSGEKLQNSTARSMCYDVLQDALPWYTIYYYMGLS
jgi:hypothetical protein